MVGREAEKCRGGEVRPVGWVGWGGDERVRTMVTTASSTSPLKGRKTMALKLRVVHTMRRGGEELGSVMEYSVVLEQRRRNVIT